MRGGIDAEGREDAGVESSGQEDELEGDTVQMGRAADCDDAVESTEDTGVKADAVGATEEAAMQGAEGDEWSQDEPSSSIDDISSSDEEEELRSGGEVGRGWEQRPREAAEAPEVQPHMRAGIGGNAAPGAAHNGESGENEGDDDGEEGWIGEDYDDSGDVEYGSRVGGGVGGIAGKSPARLQYEEFLRQLTSKMEAEKGACSLLFVSLISLSL